MFELMENYTPSAEIKVIGVGGGGGNAVAQMIDANIDGVEFIAANTDAQALRQFRGKTILQLGSSVTKGLGAGANPEVDGLEIAFSRRWLDSFEILRVSLGDSLSRPLLANPGHDVWPRWSPDGRHVAFFSRRDTNGDDDEIYLLDLPSGGVTRLTDRTGNDFCPAWSPEGDRLVFVSVDPDGARSLRILDTNGAEVMRLAQGYHRVTEPSWSPDGRFIAFAGIRFEGDSYQVFIEPVP